jgi:hypothetical protein
MNKGMARWRNTPIPTQNSTVEVFAMLSRLTLSGHVGVNLESIVLGAMSAIQPGSQTVGSPSPVKKRKFASTAAMSVYCTL